MCFWNGLSRSLEREKFHCFFWKLEHRGALGTSVIKLKFWVYSYNFQQVNMRIFNPHKKPLVDYPLFSDQAKTFATASSFSSSRRIDFRLSCPSRASTLLLYFPLFSRRCNDLTAAGDTNSSVRVINVSHSALTRGRSNHSPNSPGLEYTVAPPNAPSNIRIGVNTNRGPISIRDVCGGPLGCKGSFSIIPLDAKLDSKNHLHLLPELADLNNCNNALYFEARRHEDLYLWATKTPNGPSVKMHVQNVHTMDELKMTGNCLKGSRGLVSFDKGFDETEWGRLVKELFTHVSFSL